MKIKYFKNELLEEVNLSKQSIRDYEYDTLELFKGFVDMNGSKGVVEVNECFARYEDRFFVIKQNLFLSSGSVILNDVNEVNEFEYNELLEISKSKQIMIIWIDNIINGKNISITKLTGLKRILKRKRNNFELKKLHKESGVTYFRF